jgi:hypothetical protein
MTGGKMISVFKWWVAWAVVVGAIVFTAGCGQAPAKQELTTKVYQLDPRQPARCPNIDEEMVQARLTFWQNGDLKHLEVTCVASKQCAGRAVAP